MAGFSVLPATGRPAVVSFFGSFIVNAIDGRLEGVSLREAPLLARLA
jgi:hypothetical protein